MPQEVINAADLAGLLERFKASYLFIGHGSRNGIKDFNAAMGLVLEVKKALDTRWGSGQWLAVYGGDPYDPSGMPDISHAMKVLVDEGVPVLAIQCTMVRDEWGGGLGHIPYVNYYDTERGATGEVLWGGMTAGGDLCGGTRVYLGQAFREGEGKLQGVVALGGGPTSLSEARYALEVGIPVFYVPIEAQKDTGAGAFGAIHEWASQQATGLDKLAG